MVLENYVILETGVPARVHFTDHIIEKRTITDPSTGLPATRNVLIFEVDRLNFKEVSAKYSTMSEKHALQFQPFLSERVYRDYDFVITKIGEGFRTSWSVQTIPH
jgi:hypothetical protein